MKKFNQILKEKQHISQSMFKKKVLNDFEKVYESLLSKYNVSAYKSLNESNRKAFVSELNSYWSEGSGLSKQGEEFVKDNAMFLNESSTSNQKKNYLKTKTIPLINETLRQSELKWKLYDIIDEMYKQVKGSSVNDVLLPKEIATILKESFSESISSFLKNIHTEILKSSK